MAAQPRVIRLRRTGVCDTCRRQVSAGSPAWWLGAKPTVTCLICRPAHDTSVETPPPATVVANADTGPLDLGVAGASALHEYERRRAAREARMRAKWGRFAAVALAVSQEPQSTRAWQIGSVGESKLGAALAKLECSDVIVLNDRQVSGTRGNIDHIAVTASGVYVIDAKRYKGAIHTRNVSGFLRTPDVRLFVGQRDCTNLALNLDWQVAAVRKALPESSIPVHPVLCFIDAEWPLFGAPKECRGVLVESRRSLNRRLSSEGGLNTYQVRSIAGLLARALPSERADSRSSRVDL